MSLRNKLGKGIVYLQLLASVLGCQNRKAAPFGFNDTEPKLESRLEIQPPYPYSNTKVREAKEDIEKILALDSMKYFKQDSAVTFDYITQSSENLYLLRYSYGDKITVNYYCKRKNNKFERYAREILFEIRAEPYFLQVRFFGDEKGVNPDKEMKTIMTRYKIEVENGTQPKYRKSINPRSKLI